MPAFDGKALAIEVIQAMKSHVDSVVLPMKERLAAQELEIVELKKRAVEKGEKGDPGTDGKDGERGQDGTSVTIDDLAPLISEAVERVSAAIPVPADGKDGRDGVDGKNFTAEDAAPLIAEAVEKAVAAIRVPADGKDGLDGKDGKDGKDAVNLAGAMIDREGCLLLTLSDGKQTPLGVVVGKDGAQGEPGKDGLDGLGFDDLEMAYDGERTFAIRFIKGEKVQEYTFNLPIVIDRGVWKEGKYEKGDGVTWGGSFFIAQCETETKPETSDHWRLSIKRGRDGKGIDREEVKAMIERAVSIAVNGIKIKKDE